MRPTPEEVAAAKAVLDADAAAERERRQQRDAEARQQFEDMKTEARRRHGKVVEQHVLDDHPYNPGHLYWTVSVQQPKPRIVAHDNLVGAYRKLLGWPYDC